MKYNLLEILQVEFYHSYYLILFVSSLEKKKQDETMSRVFDISRKTSVILLNCNSHAVTLHFFINRTKYDKIIYERKICW